MKAPKSPSAIREPSRRSDATKARVLQAAVDLIHEKGVGGCTVEAITALTGIAKTTIYRHWPTRRDLMVDVFANLSTELPIPQTGSLRGDLVEYLAVRARQMSNDHLNRGLHTIPGLLEAAKRDPALVSAANKMTSVILAEVRQILEAGLARGEVDPRRDLEVATNLLIGAIFVRRAFLDQELTQAYIVEVVDTLLQSLSPAGRS